MKRLSFFAALTLCILTVHTAQATLTFYTDRTEWETAVGAGILTEDFESITPYFLSEGVNSTGLIDIELINLLSENEWNAMDGGTGSQNVNGSQFYQGGCNANSGTVSNSGADFIDIHLPGAVMAFGGDFESTYSGDGLTLSVAGEEHEFTALLPNDDGSGFLGFISTETFSTVRLYDVEKRETFGIDNVSFPTPEPATLTLLTLGGLSFLRKRK